MKHLKLLSLLLTAGVLSACAHVFGEQAPIHNYENDYQYSQSIPVMVTSKANFATVESYYPVPQHRPAFKSKPSLIPPGNQGAS
jgi:hypothetical protein